MRALAGEIGGYPVSVERGQRGGMQRGFPRKGYGNGLAGWLVWSAIRVYRA